MEFALAYWPEGDMVEFRWKGHGQICMLEPSLWQSVSWMDRRREMEFGVRHRVTVLISVCHLNPESG